MGKITENYIYNLVYQLLIVFVALVTAPHLARTLGAEGTGTYSYVYSMSYLFAIVLLMGIYNYGSRQIAYVRDDKKLLSDTFWQIMSARFILALIGTPVFFLVVYSIGKYTLLFSINYMLVLAYFMDCTWLYIGVEDAKWVVIKNIVTKCLCVAGIFIFIKTGEDVYKYVLIQGISFLLPNIIAYWQIKLYVGKPKLDFTNFKRDMKGSAILFLPALATTLYLQCDKIMIELLTGETTQVSFYDYSEKIVTIPLSFITVLSTVMMPRIANEFNKENTKKILELLNAAARFSLFIAFPMTLGLVAVTSKLIPWYLGTEFKDTVYAIWVISPIIIINTMTGISGNQYFTATNQIQILLKSQVTAAIANVLINAALIPSLGFYGAAIATLLTSFGVAVVQYHYLLKQISFQGLWVQAIKYCVFSCVMFGAVYFTTNHMPSTPRTNIIQVAIGFFVYITLCIMFKDEQLKIAYIKVTEKLWNKG